MLKISAMLGGSFKIVMVATNFLNAFEILFTAYRKLGARGTVLAVLFPSYGYTVLASNN